MGRLLTLLLIPLFLFVGCFNGGGGVKEKREVRVLDELGYKGLEFYEKLGGHTLSRHVGKSSQWLIKRLREEPRLRAASSFYDLKTAENCVRKAIYFNRERVRRWLRSQSVPDKLVITYNCQRPIGIKVERVKGGKFRRTETSRLRVILKKNANFGFIVLTAYPI